VIRRPCQTPQWRVDAVRGYWDPLHFVDIWRNYQNDDLHSMLCHKSKAAPKGEVPCQGWIRSVGFAAIGVWLFVMRGSVILEEVEDHDGPELFQTFTEMMVANKIRLIP
jgi:hypothetical protein